MSEHDTPDDPGAARRRPGAPIYIDALPHNADWTKRTLDLFIPDGQGSVKKVANLDDMRLYLRMNRMTVAQFKRLPAYYLALEKQPWLRGL